MSWAVSKGIEQKYLEKCVLFGTNEEAFANFKRDPDYNKILEGNERIVGEIAMNSIKKCGGWDWFLSNLDALKDNEKLGNPVLLDYNGIEVAPSTLRYANSLIEIESVLGGYMPKSVVEIGGGYGGLCKTLSIMYHFDTYTMLDLPEANLLSKKYLSHFPINFNYELQDSYDLFIADSSVSECDLETQLKYAQIAKKCKYVYVVYNGFHINGWENYTRFLAEFNGFSICMKPFKLHDNVIILGMKK